MLHGDPQARTTRSPKQHPTNPTYAALKLHWRILLLTNHPPTNLRVEPISLSPNLSVRQCTFNVFHVTQRHVQLQKAHPCTTPTEPNLHADVPTCLPTYFSFSIFRFCSFLCVLCCRVFVCCCLFLWSCVFVFLCVFLHFRVSAFLCVRACFCVLVVRFAVFPPFFLSALLPYPFLLFGYFFFPTFWFFSPLLLPTPL